MDIAGIASSLALSKIQNDVGTAMLKKTLDTQEQVGNSVVEMMNRSAMELSVNPNLGANIDVRL